MSDVLEARGYTLLLANSDEDAERERIAVEALRARRVDGLIVVPRSPTVSPHLEQAADDPAPLVLLDRAVEGLDVDVVTVDNVGSTRGAIRHLLDYGHRRIGVVVDA